MPTYVYRFVETGETIEVQQSFTDAALTEAAHPMTGDVMPVKKVFTPVGVTFKGGGFYKTDSRGKPAAAPASSSTSSSESSSGSGDSKGTAKTATSERSAPASEGSSTSSTSSGTSSGSD